MPGPLTHDEFARHLNERFAVRAPSGVLEMELTEVSRRHPDAARPFSIVFRGPIDPFLPQRTYRIEHARLEPFDLFLVPIGADRDRGFVLYEAVFN